MSISSCLRFFLRLAAVSTLSFATLVAQNADFTISGMPSSRQVCAPNDAVYTVELGSLFGFSDSVTLSSTGHPAGTAAGFSSNPVSPPGSSTLTVSGTGGAAPGDYMISIVGVAPTSTQTTTVGLSLFGGVPGPVTPTSPADGSTNVPLLPSLIWDAATQAASYLVELDDDPAFSTPVLSQNVALTGVTVGSPLQQNTAYYWRVQPGNACGVQSFSAVFSFTTGTTGGGPPALPDFSILTTPDPLEICMPADAVYTVGVGSLLGYSDSVTLSSIGQPAATSVSFSTNPVVPPGSSMFTISNTGAAAPGSYMISVVGIAPTSTQTSTVNLALVGASPGAATLTSPANGATNVPLLPSLVWNAVAQASSYDVELDDDSGFGSPEVSQATAAAGLTVMSALQPNRTYYWRVNPGNACGNQGFSAPFSFTTGSTPIDRLEGIPTLSTTGIALFLLVLVTSGLWMIRKSGDRAL